MSSTSPKHLRIFLASPGDVAQERKLALQVLEELPYEPLLRGKITVEAVAWDKSGAGAPMLATLTPQEAIKQGLPKPSECDIVIVIFWSRMGTPLPAEYQKPDGSRHLSGTEWEYWDAFQAAQQYGKPAILVYRRTEEPKIGLADPEATQKLAQWQQVEAFFVSFRNSDGSIISGRNDYLTPEDFQKNLKLHLHALIPRLAPELPSSLPALTSNLDLAIKQYLNYVQTRHCYLNLKGISISQLPLKLSLLDLYIPLKARLQLPEGETWDDLRDEEIWENLTE